MKVGLVVITIVGMLCSADHESTVTNLFIWSASTSMMQ